MLEGSLIEYWEGFAHFVAVKSGEYMAYPPSFTDLYWHSIIGNNIGGYFLGEDRKFFSPLGTGHELHFHASFGIVLITIMKAAVSREGYFLLSLLRVVVID